MKRNENSRIRSLKKSADYLKKSVIWVVVALILAALSAIITIIGPDKVGEIANVISDGLLGEIDLASIAKIGATLVCLYCLSAALSFLQNYIMAVVTLKMSYRLRGELSEKINTVPLKYFNTTSQGDILSRITNDVSTLQQGLTNSLPTIIGAIYRLPDNDVRNRMAARPYFSRRNVYRHDSNGTYNEAFAKVLRGQTTLSGRAQRIYRRIVFGA